MRLHPELQRFLRGMKTEGGQDYAAEVAARVQAHMDAQQVAKTQQAASDQFVNQMSSLKSNLMDMAKNDPTSHDLALDLAEITMRGLTNAHGAPQEAHDALLGGMQSDIAHAAVVGLAGVSADAARNALAGGRLASLIPDGAKAGLSQYIDNMAATRAVDATARQAEVARQHIQMSGQAASEWLGGMTHPTTGQLWFPDNWGQRMLQDDRLSPYDKAALQSSYRNLLQNGNPAQSDASLVHDLLSRAALPHNDPDNPSVGEVLGHAGRGLTLADAQFIAGRSGPQAPEVDQATSRIADVLDGARQQIGNQSAFGRFVNWLLPAVRAGASLDPNAKEFALTPERMATFQPTGDDIIAPARSTFELMHSADLGLPPELETRGFAMRKEYSGDTDLKNRLGVYGSNKPTLGDIFSGLGQVGTLAKTVFSPEPVLDPQVRAAMQGPARSQRLALDAGTEGEENPVSAPVQPTPKLVNLEPPEAANPADLTLSSGQNVGPVSQ